MLWYSHALFAGGPRLGCWATCPLCAAAGEVATVWAFNFFFYNKKMKRILYIGVKALSKTAAEDEGKVRIKRLGRQGRVALSCFA